ncbi:NAD(P)-dependent dehydrogenase (short-subunit alcohol dehydrogenase family) [Microbacterium resistens]|uniref:NAD(P)-dependent dehydrogenase (Short-subunit alcohol dehydrogenase family) n=1 Tax=Microbacterium resistens TaxID=156977 RepID=A0ABU1SE57_9MICO|nr:short chain dehydrogenase [Microbacterium resistens]MDR6867896.1 NAD(P)-dependent dehydrogenase (short-subunit alcohol dehydrogenase family) [Microbacterium resistens]
MAQRILVIGASGLIGGALADALDAAGHTVVRASRSSGEKVDVLDRASLDALFERVGTVDAVVAAVGSVPFKPLADLTVDDFRAGLADKTLGQLAIVEAGTPFVADGGSFTLTTGILADRPIPTGAAASVANGAVNAYVMAAAPYLPRGLRINAVSPNVLLEATGYHSSFPGFTPVPAEDVVRAYRAVIDGTATGTVVSV